MQAEAHVTAKTRAPDLAQRDATPASAAQAAAGTLPAQAADHRLSPGDAVALQLMAAFGNAGHDFLAVTVRQLARASWQGEDINEADLDFMISVVKGIKPRDQLEIMLAAQMAAVHIATMTSAERLRRADNIAKQDSAERALNRLARTFATQMEALARYRTGAEQKVVQHVSVSDGGQAIVGNVTQAPRETAGNAGASGT